MDNFFSSGKQYINGRMVKEYKILIDGKWVKSSSKETFKNISPANGKVLGLFQSGTRNDAKLALNAASKAFKSSISLDIKSSKIDE